MKIIKEIDKYEKEISIFNKTVVILYLSLCYIVNYLEGI